MKLIQSIKPGIWSFQPHLADKDWRWWWNLHGPQSWCAPFWDGGEMGTDIFERKLRFTQNNGSPIAEPTPYGPGIGLSSNSWIGTPNVPVYYRFPIMTYHLFRCDDATPDEAGIMAYPAANDGPNGGLYVCSYNDEWQTWQMWDFEAGAYIDEPGGEGFDDYWAIVTFWTFDDTTMRSWIGVRRLSNMVYADSGSFAAAATPTVSSSPTTDSIVLGSSMYEATETSLNGNMIMSGVAHLPLESTAQLTADYCASIARRWTADPFGPIGREHRAVKIEYEKPPVIRVTDRMKPPIWSLSPALVAPEWRWFWRDAYAVHAFWEGGGYFVADLAGNQRHLDTVIDTPDWVANPLGIGLDFDLSATEGLYRDSIALAAGYFDKHTVVTFAAPRYTETANPTSFALSSAGSSAPAGIIVFWDDATGPNYFVRKVDDGGNSLVTDSTTIPDGTPHVVVGVDDGSNVFLWVDGDQRDSDTSVGGSHAAISSGYLSAGAFRIDAGWAGYLDGPVLINGLWTRDWTAAEVQQFSNDPFGPLRRMPIGKSYVPGQIETRRIRV